MAATDYEGVKPTYGQKGASTDFTCPSFDHWTAFGLNAPTGTWLKGRFLRCKAPLEPSFCRCPAASPAAVPILSLTATDALQLNLDKAFQPMLHFFARMSAQPLIGGNHANEGSSSNGNARSLFTKVGCKQQKLEPFTLVLKNVGVHQVGTSNLLEILGVLTALAPNTQSNRLD